MRHLTPYRKRNTGKRYLSFIGLVCFLIAYCQQLTAQALLCIGQRAPYELRLADQPDIRLAGVDSFFVISAQRIAIRRQSETHFRVYNTRFEVVSQVPVEAVKSAGHPYFAFRLAGKWGLADSVGNLLIKPRYQAVGRVSEGLVALLDNDQWGFADLRGKWKIKPRFASSALQDSAPAFSGGFALMLDPQSGGWRYLKKDGQFRGSRAYPEAYPYLYGHAWVREDAGFYLINTDGSPVLGPYFDIVPNPGSALVPVLNKELFGFVDVRAARERSSCRFLEVSPSTNAHAAVLTTQGWTLIDSLGRLCKSDYFDYIESTGTDSYVFYTGEHDDRWAGLLSNNCSIEVPAVWRFISAFRNGFAVASADSEHFFLIDPSGKSYLRELGFRQISTPVNGFVLARNSEEYVIYSVRDLKTPIDRLPVQLQLRLVPLE